MKNANSLSGHSLPINMILVFLQIISIATIGFALFRLEGSASFWITILTSIVLTVLVFFTFIFKGTLMLATVGRVLVGAVFLVSSLIKLNDPFGFSDKLKEYFQDGALAYRFKELFGDPTFSFEGLVPHVMTLAIVIAILEGVLGVLLTLGAKSRLTANLLLLVMLFFTFLTFHTANCSSTKKFLDQDTFVSTELQAKALLTLSKVDKTIKTSKNKNGFVTIERQVFVNCVKDCGCFGDALRGSIGKSLSPNESFFKDLVLLFFTLWIVLAQGKISSNTMKENLIILPVTCIIFLGFGALFSWYLPLIFGFSILILALLFKRFLASFIKEFTFSTILVSASLTLFVMIVVRIGSVKDFKPYAIGNNLYELTRNGKVAGYTSSWTYLNLKSNEEKIFDHKTYMAEKIYAQKETWKFIKVNHIPSGNSIPASIDSLLFNPQIELNKLPKSLKWLQSVKAQIKKEIVQNTRIYFSKTNVVKQFSLKDAKQFKGVLGVKFLDTINVEIRANSMISMRNYLFDAKKILVFSISNLTDLKSRSFVKMKRLILLAKKTNIPVMVLSGLNGQAAKLLQLKLGKEVLIAENDPTELKLISRTGPSLMLLKSGIVIGKYSGNGLPKFDFIKRKFSKKKYA